MTKATDLARKLASRGPLHRVATVGAVDKDVRTVELAFSSETDTVERWFGIEILGHDDGECDLSRLNNAAPVLWEHNSGDQRGVVESAWIDGDRIGRAVVRFSRSAEGEQLFQDIVDGIVTKVSVGYNVTGLRLAEERDGVEVYRATAWQPYEISMVSVPADDTVGVGRVKPEGMSLTRSLTQFRSAATENPVDRLLALARQAPGDKQLFDGEGNFRGTHKQPAAARGFYSIRQLEIPASRATIPGTAASKKTSLSTAIVAQSRVFLAGAQMVVVPSASDEQVADDGQRYSRTRETRFDVIQAASFAKIDDGSAISPTPLEVATVSVNLDDMPAYGVRIELSRADQRRFRDGELSATALQSIAMGISRQADRVLLNSIKAAVPGGFSLAAAAAFGCEFAALRAIVGTDADGAAVAQDGTLRAGGVLAEITPEVDQTFAGVFSLAAVAIYEDISLIAERRDLNGKLELTCWVNMQPLLPVPGAFWKVGA